ncbi:hypothetical protein AB0G73_14250 [Streptomyces sp. NPDC020719]|uniref:hypothetical protein n=1 Tax=Streptomyces sp. NPDC020719 TaxID=3154896 RepID=UPI0033EFEB0D
MSNFVHDHSTRLYAVVAAALPLVAFYVDGLPTALILALAAAVLGTGELVQRVEDGKTVKALSQGPSRITEG